MQYENMKNVREAFKGTNVMYFFTWEEAIGYMGAYMLGLGPFLRLDGLDVLAAAWLTRDFTQRKIDLRRQKPFFSAEYWQLTAYIFLLPVITRLSQGMIRHLGKRGILTTYWVLNDDEEVKRVAEQTSAKAIMTDRPTAVQRIV